MNKLKFIAVLVVVLILYVKTKSNSNETLESSNHARIEVKETDIQPRNSTESVKPKVKTDQDWIDEGYVKKKIKVSDDRCACRKGISFDNGERCRIHEYNNGECGSLTPYPKGDSRGIGSEFCKKPRGIQGVRNHGHHTWFAKKKYKYEYRWVKV